MWPTVVLCFAMAFAVTAFHLNIGNQTDPRLQDRFNASSMSLKTLCVQGEELRDKNKEIFKALTELEHTKYFTNFMLNFDIPCPRWAKEKICALASRTSPDSKCDDAELNYYETNNTVQENNQNLDLDTILKGADPAQGDLINLLNNPEAYTGYQGQKVWNAVTEENCFRKPQQNSCSKDQSLDRLISGFHSSVSTHLSFKYADPHAASHKYTPNFQIWFPRVGNYQERIENLYFAYSIMLRAIQRAEPLVRNFKYETDDKESDQKTKTLINKIYDKLLPKCSQSLAEDKEMLTFLAPELRSQLISYYNNITSMINCVYCEKCRMYGKLQTYGLGTALKILLQEEDDLSKTNVKIAPNEMIAFVGFFTRLSQSVYFTDELFRLRREHLGSYLKFINNSKSTIAAALRKSVREARA
eukprot:TRINITY_DN5465_c0_g1_i3.p1 TRINITY_DN5465_c0_g1~~TRINITY_DN5465_c0_g1_i3.p1  ORF type:complete len:415 (+),score=113.77 TRINITY_DN5465_c0_g1_i3:26-1270(+)